MLKPAVTWGYVYLIFLHFLHFLVTILSIICFINVFLKVQNPS